MVTVNRDRAPGDTHGGDVGWRLGAACASTDPEVFFPTATRGRPLARAEAAALAVCAGCPVLAPCRVWAVAELAHGVAGGLTEAERVALRRTGRPDTHRRPHRPGPATGSPVSALRDRVAVTGGDR
ncbi:WhiB family transcriptional regulator [Pseudonocardia sp. NPDC049635]|uniref:WhiB family transcriptional regulator n=1 Tax=Pseudonocardia sp. NPDC049635 TaxID=3155506 RepID=UPI0033FB8EBD